MQSWKVCLVVTPKTQCFVGEAISNLRNCGFESITTISFKGVSIKTSEDVIKLRLGSYDVTSIHENALDSILFAESFMTATGSFLREIDNMLIISADIALWYDIKRFVEATIEPSFIGMYFPYTPKPFFMGEEYNLPGERIGWYEFVLSEPVLGSCCLIANKHTCALIGAQIKESMYSMSEWCVEPWTYRLKEILTSTDVCCFASGRSMAAHRKREIEKERAVPLTAKLREGFDRFAYYF